MLIASDSFASDQTVVDKAAAATFVGSKKCAACHQVEYKNWQGSHHDMAMQYATKEFVKGNFNNASFVTGKQTSYFFTKQSSAGEEYWLKTKGPNDKFENYQIKYTFGFEPLQQYMVKFDDGRVQLVPFAWDTRPKDKGGQRWFNLYPEQTEKYQQFFWTNSGQNWNYMCADCHSTNVNKNYDLASNTYKTSFSEINVGCEACHGAGSEHLTWSIAPNVAVANAGFDRSILKSVSQWVLKTGDSTRSPDFVGKIERSQQTIVCAQCHSLRLQISNKNQVKSNSFGERYLLNLIDAQRYYPDGQVFDEDYVYGSFLQSKMYKNGIDCSNCHNPHSTKLILPKAKLCLQCHQAATYQTTAHHQHKKNSTGSQCINCHMPATTYMKIDNRRDHGWHIPRPDLAKQLGTPDTCLSCHQDKNSAWSSKKTKLWYGNNQAETKQKQKTKPKAKPNKKQHFSLIFDAIDNGDKNAITALSMIANDPLTANIIRASALARMQGANDKNTITTIANAANSNDENIKIGAIRAAQFLPASARWQILSPLLANKVLAVRAEAAMALTPLWTKLSVQQKMQLSPALDDYIAIQVFNADRGYAHTNRGNIFVFQQKYKQAENAFKTSLKIEPNFVNAYVNLADLYRQLARKQASLAVLTKGLTANPTSGILAYSLGLAYIRDKQTAKAIAFLKKATLFEPNNSQFSYVYELAVNSR
jgi:predicted CXXCH cytochrome family protein